MAHVIYGNLPFEETELSDVDRNLALGRFLTAWSQIETVWGFIFNKFCGSHPHIGFIIFDNISTDEQRDIVAKLSENLPNAADRETMTKIMEEVANISAKRNKIVHASWGTFNSEVARFYRNMTRTNIEDLASQTDKGVGIRQSRVFTIGDLNALTTQCVSLRDRLLEAYRTVEPEPSPFVRERDQRLADMRAKFAEMQSKASQQPAPETDQK